MRVVVAAACLVLTAAPALSQSIVGRWSDQANCASDSVITIGAMSLMSADVDCRFASVKRAGATVTWSGTCDGAEGSNRQTVIATLKGDVLSFRYVPGGNWVDNLRRCR
jgi:hypothetical protein